METNEEHTTTYPTLEQIEYKLAGFCEVQDVPPWGEAHVTNRLDDMASYVHRLVADALEAATTGTGWEIEHRPGHMDARMRGGAFVGSSVIAPGYVGQYIAEGGSVVSRRVGPWEPVEGENE